MSTPDPRLSRRDAERLLDAPAEHDSVLGWALTAASAPAHPSELRGEDTAAAAFHAARLSPAPSSRSGYVSPSRLGSRAAARAVVATGVVVALTSGGFALASSTDLPGLPGLPGLPALPGQASDRASDSTADAPRGAAGSVTPGDSGSADGGPSGSATGSPGASGSTGSTSTTSPGSPSATPSETPSQTPPETSDGPATPSPSFEGLCRAFQATDRSDAGSSLDSAALLALATQAGGADRIATYCVDLIGPPKATSKPTPSPASPPVRAHPVPGQAHPVPGQAHRPAHEPGQPEPGQPEHQLHEPAGPEQPEQQRQRAREVRQLVEPEPRDHAGNPHRSSRHDHQSDQPRELREPGQGGRHTHVRVIPAAAAFRRTGSRAPYVDLPPTYGIPPELRDPRPTNATDNGMALPRGHAVVASALGPPVRGTR